MSKLDNLPPVQLLGIATTMLKDKDKRIAELERIVRLYLHAKCYVERESINVRARAAIAAQA